MFMSLKLYVFRNTGFEELGVDQAAICYASVQILYF